MGRLAYEALEGTAARIADALQRAVDRAKRDVETAHWQVIRKAHDRLNRVVAEQPLSNACHWLDFHLWYAEVQRQYQETMSKRSVRSACRRAPIGAMISGWRIEQNKCPLTA